MPKRGKKGHRRGPPTGRSQPTHFLCLPIVNASSIQQLAKSVGRFRTIAGDDGQRQGFNGKEDESPLAQGRLIPHSAFRPLGTLHLTLGVMHLKAKIKRTKSNQQLVGNVREKTPPRLGSDSEEVEPKHKPLSTSEDQHDKTKTLEEVISFLQGLDLASMLARCTDLTTESLTNSEEVTEDRSVRKGGARGGGATLDGEDEDDDTKHQRFRSEPRDEENPDTASPLQIPSLHKPVSPPPVRSRAQAHSLAEPIKVSLSGLSCFPSAMKATVLHIPPYDPTNRLLPFAESLRDAFLSSGFLQPDNRPLNLHASVVNTIYAGRNKRRPMVPVHRETTNIDMNGLRQDIQVRPQDKAGDHNGNEQQGNEQDRTRLCEPHAASDQWKARPHSHQYPRDQQQSTDGRTKRKQLFSRLTIDAREILEAFNHHGGRMTTSPSGHNTTKATHPSPQFSHHEQTNPPPCNSAHENEPYVWATNVLIDRVRICKMGAKPVPKADDGLQLKQEYEVVAEKTIIS